MYRLLLDSSDTNLIVGISLDDKIIYRYFEYAWQRQSEFMIPVIDKALKECNIVLKDVNQVVLGIGPGSYTGVRIPLTIAKVLNASAGIEVVGLSSLQILGNKDEKFIALLNARSARSYIGIYSNGEVVLKDTIIENAKLEEFLKPYIEDGYVLKGNLTYLRKENTVDEKVLDNMLSHALESEVVKNVDGLCPVYLKD